MSAGGVGTKERNPCYLLSNEHRRAADEPHVLWCGEGIAIKAQIMRTRICYNLLLVNHFLMSFLWSLVCLDLGRFLHAKNENIENRPTKHGVRIMKAHWLPCTYVARGHRVRWMLCNDPVAADVQCRGRYWCTVCMSPRVPHTFTVPSLSPALSSTNNKTKITNLSSAGDTR